MTYIPVDDIIAISVVLIVFTVYYGYFLYLTLHPDYSKSTQVGRNLETMSIWGHKHSVRDVLFTLRFLNFVC